MTGRRTWFSDSARERPRSDMRKYYQDLRDAISRAADVSASDRILSDYGYFSLSLGALKSPINISTTITPSSSIFEPQALQFSCFWINFQKKLYGKIIFYGFLCLLLSKYAYYHYYHLLIRCLEGNLQKLTKMVRLSEKVYEPHYIRHIGVECFLKSHLNCYPHLFLSKHCNVKTKSSGQHMWLKKNGILSKPQKIFYPNVTYIVLHTNHSSFRRYIKTIKL